MIYTSTSIEKMSCHVVKHSEIISMDNKGDYSHQII